MNLRRFLRPEAIRLELRTQPCPSEEEAAQLGLAEFDVEDEEALEHPRNLSRIRKSVLEEITELFDATGGVNNIKRFGTDLTNRDKKGGTAVGMGIIIPHVRTLQVRQFVMTFARSASPLPWETPDDVPARLFFGLAAPPYDDRTYLKVYKTLAKLLIDPQHQEQFLTAEEPSEVLRILEILC